MKLPQLPQLPRDKANHVVYGLAVYLAVAPFFGGAAATCAVVAVAMLKEMIDWRTKTGTPEIFDFAATVVGGLAGLACSMLTA